MNLNQFSCYSIVVLDSLITVLDIVLFKNSYQNLGKNSCQDHAKILGWVPIFVRDINLIIPQNLLRIDRMEFERVR